MGGMTLENVKGKKVIITLALISFLASIYSFAYDICDDSDLLPYGFHTLFLMILLCYIWPIAVKGLFAVYIFRRMKNKKCDHLFLAILGIIVIGVIICCLDNVCIHYGFQFDGFFNDRTWIKGPEWMDYDYFGSDFFGLQLFLMLIVGFIESIRGNKKLMVAVMSLFSINVIIFGLRFMKIFQRVSLRYLFLVDPWGKKYTAIIMDVLFFAAMIIFLLKNDIPNMWLNGKKKRGKLSREEEYGMLKADHKKGVIDNEKFEELKSELFLRV